MLVLPPKYVNDMRMLPSTIASPTIAHAHNLMGTHTNMNIILRNNLHFRTLQLKLTPNLGSLTDPMKEELEFALQKELPNCESMNYNALVNCKRRLIKYIIDSWVAIKPYHSILQLVARISARIFLGYPLCRNEQWLEISTQFTENGMLAILISN